MAKKKKTRRRAKTTFPLAVIAGLAAGMQQPVRYLISGDIEDTINEVSRNYTGYNPKEKKWHWEDLKRGAAPLFFGALIHKGATAFGINRMLARAGVPYLRI